MNLTGDVAGETYAFVYAKPAFVVMNSYATFSKTPKLILTFIQTIDIDLKQRLMKNWNRVLKQVF